MKRYSIDEIDSESPLLDWYIADEADAKIEALKDQIKVCAQALNYEERKNEQLKAELYDCSMAKTGIDLYGLKEAAEASKKDAERYRWLRDQCFLKTDDYACIWFASNRHNGDNLDAAIDEAMGGEMEGEISEDERDRLQAEIDAARWRGNDKT